MPDRPRCDHPPLAKAQSRIVMLRLAQRTSSIAGRTYTFCRLEASAHVGHWHKAGVASGVAHPSAFEHISDPPTRRSDVSS
jgi:hypothetical protein